MQDFYSTVKTILDKRKETPKSRSLLAAFSGIDGCGKGYLTTKICAQFKTLGINTVVINGDGWLNLPEKRFNQDNQAKHFYLNGFRFGEMFSQLVLPLKNNRSINLEANFVAETATTYQKYHYEFKNIDVILLEGIYLLQPDFLAYYDLSFWIDCSFKTALTRALARGQEGLSQKETINAYRTIFFPAQIIHFQKDDPKGLATEIIKNEEKIPKDYHYPAFSEIED